MAGQSGLNMVFVGSGMPQVGAAHASPPPIPPRPVRWSASGGGRVCLGLGEEAASDPGAGQVGCGGDGRAEGARGPDTTLITLHSTPHAGRRVRFRPEEDLTILPPPEEDTDEDLSLEEVEDELTVDMEEAMQRLLAEETDASQYVTAQEPDWVDLSSQKENPGVGQLRKVKAREDLSSMFALSRAPLMTLTPMEMTKRDGNNNQRWPGVGQGYDRADDLVGQSYDRAEDLVGGQGYDRAEDLVDQGYDRAKDLVGGQGGGARSWADQAEVDKFRACPGVWDKVARARTGDNMVRARTGDSVVRVSAGHEDGSVKTRRDKGLGGQAKGQEELGAI